MDTNMFNPIFKELSDFVSPEDNRNFLDEFVSVLQAILDYYHGEEKLEHPITTNSVKLIQANLSEYIFLIDATVNTFDVVKVTDINNGTKVEKFTSFAKLVQEQIED